LSDLVDSEDLEDLDGGDLKAVLGQVGADDVLAALVGARAGFRDRLLTKLPRDVARRLEAQLATFGPVSLERARAAQRALVEALCRLSRGGQIAFDDPEDMVA